MTYVQDLLLRRIVTPTHREKDMETMKRTVAMGERIAVPRITPLLWGRDYFVRAIDLPHHIGGVSTVNPDGTYNIYVNQLLPVELQWEAFLHELLHCEAGHLDEWCDLPDEVKEWEADNLRPIVLGEDIS